MEASSSSETPPVKVALLQRPNARLNRESQPQHDARSTNHGSEAERDRFGNYFEYLVSVLGYAAGFGSVWRFPYLVFKNGGGVFLIPYLLFLFLIAIPAFYFETALGQIFQRGPAQIFERIHKKWKGLGLFQVCMSLSMAAFYNLILAYSLYFLWKSFSFPLPWALDNPEESETPWNKAYFYDDFLQASSGLDELGGMVWPIFVCFLISQSIVYVCIQNGISVSGRIALFTATSPYVLLILLMLRGFFLEGAFSGISYLFSPDWSKLGSLQVWADAANQVIFQFGPGCGVLVFFGSYRNPKQEVKHSAVIIPLLTASCGFLAAFVIFSFMGYLSHLTGLKISEIPLAGPDLAFVVFPAVLTYMPFSNVLSIIFFLTMVFLGIDSQFALVDCLAGAIEDEFHGRDIIILNKKLSVQQVRFLLCAALCLGGFLFCSQAGFYYLSFVDGYGLNINLLVSVGVQVSFFMWKEDWQPIEKAIVKQIGDSTPSIFIFACKYIVPVFTAVLGLIALVIQVTDIGNHRWWVSILGWCFTLYPYVGIYYYYQQNKEIPDKQQWSIHSTGDSEEELVDM